MLTLELTVSPRQHKVGYERHTDDFHGLFCNLLGDDVERLTQVESVSVAASLRCETSPASAGSFDAGAKRVSPRILWLGLWRLSGPNYDVIYWNVCTVFRLILHGVIPAFATFGFHRLWLGIVELNPHLFYVRNRSELPQRYRQIRGEPTIHSLRLPGVTGPLDLLFAFIYIGVASVAVYVFP